MKNKLYSFSLILILVFLFRVNASSECTTSITISSPYSSLCEGSSLQLIAYAIGGTTITYQWQVDDKVSGFINIDDNALYNGSTNSILNLNGIPASINGYSYRCIATSPECSDNPIAYSSDITISVNPLPSVSIASYSIFCPSISSIPLNGYATTGTNLIYNWSTTGTGTFSSVTTPTTNYSPSDADKINGATLKLAVASNGCQNTNEVKIKFLPEVTITSQPSDQTLCQYSSAFFNVQSSSPDVSYQWKVDRGFGFEPMSAIINYSGATTKTLVLSSVNQTMNGYRFMAEIMSPCGVISSNPAYLIINNNPIITTHPSAETICQGQTSLNLIVTAVVSGGIPVNYQWEVDKGSGYTILNNDANHANVTSPSLNINAITPLMNGWKYMVTLSNSCGFTTSNSTTLTIKTSENIFITSKVLDSLCLGTSSSFTANPITGAKYQWQVDKGSGYENIGTLSGSNTISQNFNSTEMSNWSYRVKVTESSCEYFSNAVKRKVKTPLAKTTQSGDQSLLIGDDLNIKMDVTGNGPFNYSWNKNNIPFLNNSNIFQVSNVQISDTGRYSLSISNQCNTIISDPINVYVTSISEQALSQTIDENNTVTFSITSLGTNVNYQWQVDKGDAFENIQDGNALKPLAGTPTYSGTSTNQLTITNTSFEMNGYKFRCYAQADEGNEYSEAATLTVNKTTGIHSSYNNVIEIYPNPTQEYLYIKNLPENAEVSIYNQQGILVKSFLPGLTYFSIMDIQNGYYILEVKESNKISRVSFVIK